MKILQTIHCFPPENMSGSEIYAYNLAKELSKNNKVSIFYRINNRRYKEYEIIEGAYNGLTVYKINNTLRKYFSLRDIYINKYIEDKFLQVLDKVKPDIVHIHHLLFLSTGIIREIKKRHTPVLFTLHDYWLICPRGQLLKNNLQLCHNPLNSNCLYCLVMSLNVKNMVKKLYRFSFGFKRIRKRSKINLEAIYNDVDLFIAPSRFLYERFIEFGMPPEKIIYSSNGMNLSLFKDMEKSRSDNIRFGFIATLIPSKGVHILIKAFNRIRRDDVILKIYGKPPANNGIFDYFHRMKIMAAGNKNIKFMGTFDNNGISRIFKEIDVLVFPSIWEENSPLVLHEAILTRTPVIASDAGGVSEIIQHGKNGLLFRRGDWKQLSEFIKDIVKNPDILRTLSGAAQLKNIEDNAKELEGIYYEKIKN